MITCPECGQQVTDDATFCDRCGQGLATGTAHPHVSSVSPLEAGTLLRREYSIIGLLSSTAHENRYRAKRTQSDEPLQLRERAAPLQPGEEPVESVSDTTPRAEDPAGPRAKTAELRVDRSAGGTVNHRSEASALQSGSANDLLSGHERSSTELDVSPLVSGYTEELAENADDAVVQVLTDAMEEAHPSTSPREGVSPEPPISSEAALAPPDDRLPESEPYESKSDDLGEVFGRVLALSITLNHPGFERATASFADRGRVYLVYPDEELTPLSARSSSLRMEEGEALQIAIQVCQAVGFVHRRGLRVNDICPESVAHGANGRVKLTGLDCVSNDNELQNEPIFNDGYTAPEIYRGKKVDKRADIFSIGALLYTCVTGERLDSESWREEGGPIRFYPPHVVTPALEQAIRRALQFDPAARWPNVDALKSELVKLATAFRVHADLLTDVGMVREHNEDSVLSFECRRDSLIDPAQTLLYVVADGMGGAAAGELASAIAIETIRNYVEAKVASTAAGEMSMMLQQALEQANTGINEYQVAHPETRSMGSTAVAALVYAPEAAIAWVGDSRAYLCNGAGLRQLSKDHSLVQRLIDIGQITAAEARHHEHKNVITRSLGARPSGPAGVESVVTHLKRGDRLLLCSDGLTTHVDDEQIDEILRRHSDPTAAVRELVAAANAGGGTDNVSVVVIIAG